MPRTASAPAHDLTRGPIARTLLLFSLPTLGSNILQSLNGSINAVWIGRFLGESGLAAASNANLILFLMFALGFGFAMAATILAGQAMGAGDIAGVRRAIGGAGGLFLLLSGAVAGVGWLSADALLRLLDTPRDVHASALAYLRVIFLGLPPMFLTTLLTMGLRAVGDAVTPLRFMLLSVALDAGLNPVLILGLGPAPRLGIAGAATATLIANYAVLAGLLLYIYLRDVALRLRGAELRYLVPDAGLLRTILVKGVPMGLQMLVMTFSGLVMTGMVNRQGTLAAAAYGVVQQLWAYLQMPALAVGTGVSAMAAQSIGAGRTDRLGGIARAGILINLAMTAAGIAVLLVLARPALALFLGTASPAIPIAARIQLIANWSFLTFGVTLVLFAVVRANGVVVAPLVILGAGLVGVRVAAAVGFERWLGPAQIWWSFPIGSAATTAMAVAYYLRGGWRRASLAGRPSPSEVAAQGAAAGEQAGRLQPAAD